jgi:hypothetical protein
MVSSTDGLEFIAVRVYSYGDSECPDGHTTSLCDRYHDGYIDLWNQWIYNYHVLNLIYPGIQQGHKAVPLQVHLPVHSHAIRVNNKNRTMTSPQNAYANVRNSTAWSYPFQLEIPLPTAADDPDPRDPFSLARLQTVFV